MNFVFGLLAGIAASYAWNKGYFGKLLKYIDTRLNGDD